MPTAYAPPQSFLTQVTSELTAVIKEIGSLGEPGERTAAGAGELQDDGDGGGGGGGETAAIGSGGAGGAADASAKLGELMDRLTKLKATVRSVRVCVGIAGGTVVGSSKKREGCVKGRVVFFFVLFFFPF